MKLKFKLSIIVIAILLAVVGSLSLVILTQASSMITKLSINSIERLASQQASYWKGREESYLTIASVAAGYLGDYEHVNPEDRREQFDHFLESTLEAQPNLVGIFAVFKPQVLDGLDYRFRGAPGCSPEGIYAPWFIQKSGQIEKQTYDGIPSALNILNGPDARKPPMKDPEPETVNGKATYTFRMAAPIIHTETKNVVGMVGLIIKIDAVQPVVEQIVKDNADISVMSVYTDNSTIIGSYQSNRIGKLLREADDSLYSPYTNTAEDAVLHNKLVHLKVYSNVLRTNVELVLYPFAIGETGATWSVMIGTTEAMILKEVRTLTGIVVGIALGVSLAMTVLVFFILSATTKPIVHVANTLKDISEGEGDLTKSIEVSGNDEIANLSTYFNKTLEKIKNLVMTIKQQSVTLFDIGNELAANMTETAAAINEITASIQGIKGRVINQSASVTETNATMEQITLNIDRLNGNVEKQSASVSKSSSAIEEMIASINAVTQTLARNTQSVQELLEASDVGRTGLQEVATDIQEIARESAGLLEINAVMENIAGQTNLLSMNAAIEAAHAGEAGKGFAVVADEIRKLAESSSEQSKTIGTVLKKIKESIDKIILSTENVMNKFTAIDDGVKLVSEQVENIRTAMEEQSVGSQQILEVMGQLNQLTQLVKNGSDEMLEGSKQIMVEGRNLEHATEEISNGMNEMATGADQINVAVNRVNGISGQNKENIGILVKEVSRFKVE